VEKVVPPFRVSSFLATQGTVLYGWNGDSDRTVCLRNASPVTAENSSVVTNPPIYIPGDGFTAQGQLLVGVVEAITVWSEG
jgi:hypothetical protein